MTRARCWFHTLGLAAHLAATGRTSPAVNLKLLVEGEEESGSAHFAELLRENRQRLRCDAVVVSDTGVYGRDTIPAVHRDARAGRRQIDVAGPQGDLHSGSFGGAVPNPATSWPRLHRCAARRRRPGDVAGLL